MPTEPVGPVTTLPPVPTPPAPPPVVAAPPLPEPALARPPCGASPMRPVQEARRRGANETPARSTRIAARFIDDIDARRRGEQAFSFLSAENAADRTGVPHRVTERRRRAAPPRLRRRHPQIAHVGRGPLRVGSPGREHLGDVR